MKLKKITLLIIAALAVAFSPVAKAQSLTATNVVTTNQVPNQLAGSFLTSVQAYFTSFNEAYTWTNVTIEAESGYKQVTGVNAASFVAVQYDFGNFNVGADIQFSGVGSPINGAEGQFGYAIVNHFDTKLELDLLAGYSGTPDSWEIEPKIEAKKKLTTNTFASVAISEPIFFVGKFNSNPTFWAGVGFTF